jgi:hypothetical protein
MYKAPHLVAPPYSVTRTVCHRLLHAVGPAGQQKKCSTGWSSNYGRKGGIKKCEKREKKAPFIGEEVAAPSSWW